MSRLRLLLPSRVAALFMLLLSLPVEARPATGGAAEAPFLTWSSPRASFRYARSAETDPRTWTGRKLLERLDYLSAVADDYLAAEKQRVLVQFAESQPGAGRPPARPPLADGAELVLPIKDSAQVRAELAASRSGVGTGQSPQGVDVQVAREVLWSPDGQWLLGRTWSDDRTTLWLQNERGEYRRVVTSNRSFVEAPSWSPDSGAIAYLSDGRLMICDVHGLVSNPVTGPDSQGDLTAYAWSPQSQQLAAAFRDAPDSGHLLVFDRENGLATHTVALPAGLTTPPVLDWSPDGHHVLARAGGRAWVYEMLARRWVRLASGALVQAALWDPAGRGLALVIRGDQGGTRLLTVDPRGSRLHEWVLSDAESTPLAVSWSPHRVLLASPAARAVLIAATEARSLQTLPAISIREARYHAESSAALSAARAANKSAGDPATPAAWLAALTPGRADQTAKELAKWQIRVDKAKPLGSHGWTAGATPAQQPVKLLVLRAREPALTELMSLLDSAKAVQLDLSPSSRTVALISARTGLWRLRKVSLRDGAFGGNDQELLLTPPKHTERPPWVWPAAVVLLLVLTFFFGVYLTRRRMRH